MYAARVQFYVRYLHLENVIFIALVTETNFTQLQASNLQCQTKITKQSIAKLRAHFTISRSTSQYDVSTRLYSYSMLIHN
jgi:hypothetical protein